MPSSSFSGDAPFDYQRGVVPAALLALMVASLASVWLSNQDITALLLSVLLNTVIFLTAIVLGHRIVRFLEPAKCGSEQALVAFVIGNLALSLCLFLGVYILHTSVLSTFLFLFLVAIFISRGQGAMSHFRVTKNEWFVLLAAAICSTRIYWFVLDPFEIADSTVVLRNWEDISIHTSTILMLGGDLAEGRYQAFGEPAKFYHYAPYMMAALNAKIGFVPALEIANSLWGPFSYLLFTIGLYTLVAHVWGDKISIFISVAALLLPDAAQQLDAAKWFGFHWLLQISPGCSWGLAIFSVGLRYLLIGLDEHQYKLTIFALCLALMMIFFRAQFLPITVSFFVLIFLIHCEQLSLRLRSLTLVLGVASTYFVLQFVANYVANPSLSGPSGATAFLQAFLPSYTFTTPQVDSVQLFGALDTLAHLLANMIGISLGLYLAIFLIGVARHHDIKVLTLPIVLIFTYLCWVIYLPQNRGGNPFELQHRSFVIVYVMVTTWTVGFLTQFLSQRRPVQRSMLTKTFAVAVAVGALGWANYLLPMRKDFIHYDRAFVRGEYDIALSLRDLASGTDRFLDSGYDPFELVVGVSQKRSFLSRPDRFSIKGNPQRKNHFQELRRVGDEILDETDKARLLHLTSQYQIAWIILRPEQDHGVLDARNPLAQSHGFRLHRVADLAEQHKDFGS